MLASYSRILEELRTRKANIEEKLKPYIPLKQELDEVQAAIDQLEWPDRQRLDAVKALAAHQDAGGLYAPGTK